MTSSISNKRYDNCILGPNGFNQKAFVETMQLTKPFHAIPFEPDDTDSKRIPFETLFLRKAFLNEFTPQQNELMTHCNRLCKGAQVTFFNKWRWITYRTSLLMSQVVKSQLLEQMDTLTVREPFWDITKLFEKGVDEIETYLAVPNTSHQLNLPYFERGKAKLLEVEEKLRSQPNISAVVTIKEHVHFLKQCLENQELFSILLLPADEQDSISDYGLTLIEVILKTAHFRPKEALRVIDESLVPCLKTLKENFKVSLPPLAKKKEVLEAIDKGLHLCPKLSILWLEVEKLGTNPHLLQCKEFAEKAEKGDPFTLKMHRDWSKTAQNFSHSLRESLKEFDFLVMTLSSIYQILDPYLKKDQNFKNKEEENHFMTLGHTFYWGFAHVREDARIMLTVRFHNLFFILESFTTSQKDLWKEQARGLSAYETWLEEYPSKIAPSLERLADGLCKQMPHLNPLNILLFTETCNLISYLRMYGEQMGTLDREAKARSIQSMILTLDHIEQRVNYLGAFSFLNPSKDRDQYLLDFVASLRSLLADESHYHNDLFFLLHITDLSALNQNALKGSLSIPRHYLYGYVDQLDAIVELLFKEIPTISKASFGEKGDALSAPLLQRFQKFKAEMQKREQELKALLDQNLETVGNFLIDFKAWATAEKNGFLAEYNRTLEALSELVEKEEAPKEILTHLETILINFTNCEYEKLETYIFSPTHLLRKWTIIESLNRSRPAQVPRALPPPPPQPVIAPQIASEHSEKRDILLRKPVELIDRIAKAAPETVPDLHMQDCLDNIRIDLLPSILEIVDNHIFSQRLFEKTKLLLEQSLKYALASKNKAVLFEKTNDWRAQQRVASHSLLDLFAPLSPSFDEDITPLLTYFSRLNPSESLRAYVGNALAVSERLLKFSKKKGEEFLLSPLSPSQPLPVQVSAEMESAVLAIASAVLEKKERFVQKEQESAYVVQRMEDETKQSILQRQFFLWSCLDTMEKTTGRLQTALRDGREEMPLSYCGELCHTAALLLENALTMLIAYHRIAGEEGNHKIFQKVSSATQTRIVRYVHQLKQLSEILQNHYANHYPDSTLFADPALKESIELFQSYNTKTHRYLGQDETLIGKEFKNLHKERQWGGEMSSASKIFRDEYIHKNVLGALAAATKHLKALSF